MKPSSPLDALTLALALTFATTATLAMAADTESSPAANAASADYAAGPRTQASYYRAEILLDSGEIAKLDGQTLLPGMPVEAFIETGARTPMAYLLKPFTDYFTRAFRES